MNRVRPLALAALCLATRTQAQCAPEWLPGDGVPGITGWGEPGEIAAAVAWDPDGAGPLPEWLVVAGRISWAGTVSARNIAAWDGTHWRALGDGIIGGGQVSALTIYQGDLIAGGWFTSAGGTPCSGIARWNGVTWQPLGSGIQTLGGNGGFVYALGVYQGELIAGGSFSFAGGLPCAGIARWNGAAWQPVGGGMAFGSGGGFGVVYALETYNGELVAGGLFEFAGGTACRNLARWNGAVWQPVSGGVTSQGGPGHLVHALAVFDGELIAGGFFESVGAVKCKSIARWNGQGWAPLGVGVARPPYYGVVTALTAYGGELVAGGSFTLAGGAPCNGLARWNGSSWQGLATGADEASFGALTVWNTSLVAGGIFKTVGDAPCSNVACWDGAAWSALGAGFNGDVLAFAQYGGSVIAGGDFTGAAGVLCRGVARWDGGGWAPLGAGVGGGGPFNLPSVGVHALAPYEDDLIAGGLFTSAGGRSANSVARWDGAEWTALGRGINWMVNALAVLDQQLIAGGYFSMAGGVNAQCVARWDGAAWYPMGEGPGPSQSEYWVDALAVYKGEVIAAGGFGNDPFGFFTILHRWDGTSWWPLGGLAGAPGGGRALAVYEGDLVAGGWFSPSGPFAPAHPIMRWDGSAWAPMESGIDGQVSALAVRNRELFAGGGFSSAGGLPAKAIARWSGTSWGPLGTGPGLSEFPSVYAIAADNVVFAGGRFTGAGDGPSASVARWGCACYPDCNADGNLTVQDFGCFQTKFVAGDLYADCNASGTLTVADFGCFQTRFVAGCP